MNKKERDAAEMETANLIIENSKKAWDGAVVSAWDEFDITKHEWQGGHEIRSATVYDDVIELNLYITGDEFECYLAKDDAIAIARHFQLNEGDLK